MTAATLTLTEFLLARIAEDEAEIGVPYGHDDKAGPNGIGWAEVGGISDVLMCGHLRALAECEAKRRIVELHSQARFIHVCRICGGFDTSQERWPCRTLLALAAVYSDHPDYREEWRA